MTTNINLTKLREQVNAVKAGSAAIALQPDDLLSLIDTAEAAKDFLEQHGDVEEWENAHEECSRLRETLTRYTTE